MATLTKWKEAIFQHQLIILFYMSIFVLKGILFMRLVFYSLFSMPAIFFLSLLLMAKEPGNTENIFTDRAQSKLTLIYYQNIFCSQKCRKYIIEGCLKIIGQPNKLMCREQVELIRPKSLVDSWRKEQYKQGYIDFTIAEFGIKHAKVHMNHVVPFMSRLFKEGSGNTNTQLVTGVFKRHSVNVSLYIFHNVRTGKFFGIHVTPEHPFYAKNRQGFLPLESVTANDILMTGNGDNIKLVYSGRNIRTNRDNSTGIPRLVYNMEVNKKHIYFAGRDKIMVHNTCLCGICGQQFNSTLKVKEHIHEQHGKGRLKYLCGVNECPREYGQINRMNSHQMKSHKILNIHSCEDCARQFRSADKLKQHRGIRNHIKNSLKMVHSDVEKDHRHVNITRLTTVFGGAGPSTGASVSVPNFSKESLENPSGTAVFWDEVSEQTFFGKADELTGKLDDVLTAEAYLPKSTSHTKTFF